MLVDQPAQSESFMQFANENQTAIGDDSRSLEIDFKKSIEGELKRFVKSWSLTSVQRRLVKSGGRLVKHARY